MGPNGGVVCGFVSVRAGEGVSTWVELLARAAAQRNSPVVAITNRPPVNGATGSLEDALADPAGVGLAAGRVRWLIAPADWHWDGVRRDQWRRALEAWSSQPELVVLVELCDAGQPETLLFAEELPQIIWLSASGVARGRETAERLQMFQHAGCRFVGAALNREVKLFPWL